MAARPQTAVVRLIQGICAARNVAPGERVSITPHVIVLGPRDGLAVLKAFRIAGGERVADAERVLLYSDDNLPAPDAAAARRRAQLHEAARQAGVSRILPFGGCEVAHVVEKSLVVPGECAVSNLPEIAALGGIGALGFRATIRDMAALLAGKPLQLTIPETIRLNLTGMSAAFVEGGDLLFAARRELSHARLAGTALEISVPDMMLDSRMSLARRAAHAGLFAAFHVPDREAVQQLNQRTSRPYSAIEPARNAEYGHTATLDVSQEQPWVVAPGGVHAVAVGEAAGEPIAQAALRGSIEELRVVTALLKGRRLEAPLAVAPDSPSVYSAALREGLLTFLIETGATIHAPGTPIEEMLRLDGPAIATDIAAECWRAGAATAAASACRGAVCHPETVHATPVRERKRH